MALINENYLKLPEYYFFNEIEQQISAHQVIKPNAHIIRLGLGDVSRPLTSEVIKALNNATNELSNSATFHGYGPECGYRFLVHQIIKHDYNSHGVNLSADEIFISDGSKSDVASIGHIFGRDNIIGITDPVYPVYENTTVMSGRSGQLSENGLWSNIVYIPCKSENDFIPQLPKEKADIIYLCYPNNPTGIALNKAQLKLWVDYAIENHAIIIYDGAYAAYISQPDIPHTIYEIKGAKKCAIEIRSFSKTAGFTGLRCSYIVVPHEIVGFTLYGNAVEVNQLWTRRTTTYSNGTSYLVQRAAEALYSPQGQKEIAENIQYYMTNTAIMRKELSEAGFTFYGGVNCPNLWVKTPYNMSSWRFFQQLLYDTDVVCIPGSGFGQQGEGYFRLTGFNSRENTIEALKRIRAWV